MDALRPAIRPAFSPYGPHPTGGGVVGPYVQHSYEPTRQPYQHIPGMRPAQEGTSGYSATPIYDALYSEYLRSFRTLPGDRTGEEDLGFKGFGAAAHGPGRGSPVGSYAGHTGQVGHASGATSGSGYPSPYPGYAAARPSYGTGHVPAALPPAPRRGL